MVELGSEWGHGSRRLPGVRPEVMSRLMEVRKEVKSYAVSLVDLSLLRLAPWKLNLELT